MTDVAVEPTTRTLFVILRPFEAQGLMRTRGEVVDISSWPNQRFVGSLVESRRLVELDRDATPVICALCQRVFDGPSSLGGHIRAEHAPPVSEEE